ncbi:hypothetical protein HYN69_18380 (plasmid) [Gemmobacter aquarius]|uniref:Uncharacterized protein n=2 Tax=Paragemmobacter aquarius TaxID=2169400 RepID=A0A2S0URY6_9RHOB|nr:hypothetical protein HYN69_18380 [Gemmobacter aquarius]
MSVSLFVIFFFALRTFVAEYGAVLVVSGTTRDMVATLAEQSGQLPQPASARSMRDLMSACGKALTLVPIVKADSGLAAQVSIKCESIAREILARAPSNARARAVDVLTADRIDAVQLGIAQAAAPFEPWPLNIRLQAIARAESVSPEVLAVAEGDFQRALMSEWGKEEVARIYQTRDALRQSITLAAEKAGPKDQKAFVDLLRRNLRDAG